MNLELSESIQGGKLNKKTSKTSRKNINDNKNIQYYINNLTTKPIYKMNSFGKQFIGYGLNGIIIKKLETKFNSDTVTEKKFKQYLKLKNLFYDI